MFLGAHGITPFKNNLLLTGIDKIVSDYDFLNAWSSENITIDGTTTTLIDYKGEHNLTNPAAANQPTFNSTDSNFNGKPSFTYDGTTDFVKKSVSNWRASDSSGVLISVYKSTSDYAYGMLATSDESGVSFYYGMLDDSSGDIGMIRSGSEVVKQSTGTLIYKVSAISGNGSAFKCWENGVDVTASTGTYNWLDSQSTQRDNISIGAIVRSTILYGEMDWVFSGYLPYVDEATITNLSNELVSYYGI